MHSVYFYSVDLPGYLDTKSHSRPDHPNWPGVTPGMDGMACSLQLRLHLKSLSHKSNVHSLFQLPALLLKELVRLGVPLH